MIQEMASFVRSASLTCALLLCAVPGVLSQERPARSLAELPADARIADTFRDAPGGNLFQQNAAPRDPLKNGALIGAIVGAVGTFGFGMYLCHAIREDGDPPCLRPALVLAAVGAGAGALTGAGIDALLVRHPPFRLSVRF
jgi:hypothetical protein